MQKNLLFKEKFQFRLTRKEFDMLNKLSESKNISRSTLLRGLIRKEFYENFGKK